MLGESFKWEMFFLTFPTSSNYRSWHPECFRCQLCHRELADSGFIRNNNRALCHGCNASIKASEIGKYSCLKCHGLIDGAPLRFRGEVYHGYHFNCTSCKVELDSTAREIKSRTGFAANDMVLFPFN